MVSKIFVLSMLAASLACAGCAVVDLGANVASAGVSVATGTIKAGAHVAGAAGGVVFRKHHGKCYAVDADGKETRMDCPKGG